MIEDSQGQMRDALLGTDGCDGLGVGIDIDVEAPFVPGANRQPQLEDSARHRERWLAVLAEASTSLFAVVTICGGVAPSGLPIPKSMMSSPARRAVWQRSPMTLKT